MKTEPDWKEAYLSETFRNSGNEEPCLEFKAVMININLNHNRELMERCRRLKEYAQFVALVRTLITEGLAPEVAVDSAVEKCIEEGILADILSTHRAEVHDMVLTEYDEQSHMAAERTEWKAKGKAEGILELLSDIGEVPEELKTKILDQRDLAVLKRWLKAASRADTIERFLKEMMQVK